MHSIHTFRERASVVSDAGSGTSGRSVPACGPLVGSSVPSRGLSRRTLDTLCQTSPSHPSVFCNAIIIR